jgi:hypothetical protein
MENIESLQKELAETKKALGEERAKTERLTKERDDWKELAELSLQSLHEKNEENNKGFPDAG